MIFGRKFRLLWIILFLIVLFLIIINKRTTVSAPSLLPGVYIQDGSGELDVGFYSVPLVYDWNSDGKKDLLVGLNTSPKTGGHGYIRFFENQGTDGAPSFNGFTYLQACNNSCTLLDVPAAY